MKRYLIAALAAASFAASAGERVARQGDAEVRVYDSPCVSAETIGRIPEANRKGRNKAVGVFSGQKFFGCWRALGDSIYILWEDGDQGMVPESELKAQPEA